MKTRVLVVEDEGPVRQGLIDLLQAKGYEVLSASTGSEGLIKATEGRPDLVILDVMLPGMSGFDILRTLRARGNAVPVVMLTAKGTEVDKVMGFELGVDDYVTKPFSILELLHRVQAVLRRSQATAPVAPDLLVVGQVEVDFMRLELRREGRTIEMSPRALDILKVLARSEGGVVSRDRLMNEVWGLDQEVNPRTVDNLLVKLRQAIEPNPERPRHLLTVHGRGYRLVRS